MCWAGRSNLERLRSEKHNSGRLDDSHFWAHSIWSGKGSLSPPSYAQNIQLNWRNIINVVAIISITNVPAMRNITWGHWVTHILSYPIHVPFCGMRFWLMWYISCQLHLLGIKITSVLSDLCEQFSPKFYLLECGCGCGCWCGRCVCVDSHF